MELTSYRETNEKKGVVEKANQMLAIKSASSTKRKIPRRFKVRRLRFDVDT